MDPLYDVNPVPYGDELSLNVDEEDNRIRIRLAVEVAVRFGISKVDAEGYAEDILKTVRDNWKKTAAGYGLTRRQIEEMNLRLDGDYVDIEYHFAPANFERIRRITGYLVGTLDRFNNAKRAEVEDRVKHSVS